MKYWILGGVLLIIAGLYFGAGWVQALGVGMIALPLIILALIVLFILIVLAIVLLFGSATLVKFGGKVKESKGKKMKIVGKK